MEFFYVFLGFLFVLFVYEIVKQQRIISDNQKLIKELTQSKCTLQKELNEKEYSVYENIRSKLNLELKKQVIDYFSLSEIHDIYEEKNDFQVMYYGEGLKSFNKFREKDVTFSTYDSYKQRVEFNLSLNQISISACGDLNIVYLSGFDYKSSRDVNVALHDVTRVIEYNDKKYEKDVFFSEVLGIDLYTLEYPVHVSRTITTNKRTSKISEATKAHAVSNYSILWADKDIEIEFSYCDSKSNRTRRSVMLKEVLIDNKLEIYLKSICLDKHAVRNFKFKRITSKIQYGKNKYSKQEFFDEILELPSEKFL